LQKGRNVMFRLRSYVKDYEIRESMDKRGTVKKIPVYIGPWFERVADDEMHQRLKRIYATAAVVMIALYIGCGMLDNAGNRNMINAVAYACACFPIVYNFIGMVATLRLGKRVERREYDMSIRRMYHSMVGLMILYPIAIVAEVFSLFNAKRGISVTTEILYLLLSFALVMVAWLVRYLCCKYPYREMGK